MMKNLTFFLTAAIIMTSCTRDPDDAGTFLSGNGVFIINEGNFMGGNGSLSFYSYDSSKIYNNLFASINNRPLGDVPNSMAISGDRIFIVVNNSGKIEVLDKNTLESVKTITGLRAPRNMSVVSSTKAYVSSMYSDSIAIIDLYDLAVSGYINIRRTSEAIAVLRNRAFVANWIGGNEIMVLNTDNNTVLDSVEVAKEPESMVIDNDKRLWVLCNGGWMREYFAELVAVNTTTFEIEKRLVFPSRFSSPSSLQIDGDGSTLFYLESGVKKLKTSAVAIPGEAIVPESGNYFYKLGINHVNGDILVTDAVDYQQRGHLLIYTQAGILKSDVLTEIIPGMMCFKLNDSFSRQQ